MNKLLTIGYKLSLISFLVGFVTFLSSCSKLQNNALSPVQPVSQSVIFPHPVGWADTTSSNFHGTFFINNYLASQTFDITSCATCHGHDLQGGTTKVSCYQCHKGNDGTLACNTCHGSALNPAPPKDLSGDSSPTIQSAGAHQEHLAGGAVSAPVACSSCHAVPQAAGPGMHPKGGNPTVLFSGIAMTETNTPGTEIYDPTQPMVIPSPIFDSKTLQCSNTYCHGDFKNGNNFSPKWTVLDGSQDSCGTCHGIPPNTSIHQIAFYDKSTSLNNCYFCHEPMMGPNGIQDSSLHGNGSLELYGKSLTTW